MVNERDSGDEGAADSGLAGEPAAVTAKQRESAAKYSYDLSKIVVTVAVVTNVFSERFQSLNFWLGLVFVALLFGIGYILDGMEG